MRKDNIFWLSVLLVSAYLIGVPVLLAIVCYIIIHFGL